jgi:hypothetical protein
MPRYSKKGGRPAHEPNDATRKAIRILAFGDHTQEEIAANIGIGVKTLVKYYADDIAHGKSEMRGALLKKEIEYALSDETGAPRSRQYLLNTKGGFSEKQTFEIKREPAELTDAELAAIATGGGATTPEA